MIQKLNGDYPPYILTDKLNQVIEALNDLGQIIDEYTGSDPEYRPDIPISAELQKEIDTAMPD